LFEGATALWKSQSLKECLDLGSLEEGGTVFYLEGKKGQFQRVTSWQVVHDLAGAEALLRCKGYSRIMKPTQQPFPLSSCNHPAGAQVSCHLHEAMCLLKVKIISTSKEQKAKSHTS
jgi:hypothetical protein